MPVIGINPNVIPTFMQMWVKNNTLTPTAKYVPKRSRDNVAMRNPLKINTKYASRTTLEPKNPLSSAMTEKMKSLDATDFGR